MRRCPALFLICLGLASCDCGSLDVEHRAFACMSDEDCLQGFVCRNDGRGAECLPPSISSDDAGADASVDGGLDGGITDAGTDDGGRDAGAGDGGLAFSSVPPTSLAGTCVPLTLRSVGGAVSANLDVGLSATPPSAARFSSNATCSDVITSVRIASGSASVSLFVKPVSGGQTVLTATSTTLGLAEAVLPTTPMVRRGVCQVPASQGLADGGTDGVGLSKICSFSPPVTNLNRSFLIVQPVAPTLTLTGAAQLTCRLSAVDAITCARTQDSDAVTVHFQVAEVAEGLRVVRVPQSSCSTLGQVDAGLTASRTMLLRTVSSVSNFYDDDDSPVIFFQDPDSVVPSILQCAPIHVQLLEWAGVTVTRDRWDGGVTGVQADVTGLSMTGSNTVVSSQTQTPDGVNDVCAVLLRPTISSPTSLRVSRNAGVDGGCATVPFPGLVFERIDFGARATVQQLEFRPVPAVFTSPQTIRAVDVTRTILMTSSQTIGGQGSGETDLVDPRNYTPAMAAFTLNNTTQVGILRSEMTRAAAFTVYVIELNP